MNKKIFRWWAGNDAYEREMQGANRYYAGNIIYAYPVMSNLTSSFFANKGIRAEIVSVDRELGSTQRKENVTKELLFVDPKIHGQDPNYGKNATVVEFDTEEYVAQYETKHKEWVAKQEAAGAYSDFDDRERY